MQRIDSATDYGASGWDEFLRTKEGHWRDKDYRYLDEVFRVSRFSGTLLDAGCALGDGLLHLQPRCRRVTAFAGADFSSAGIQTCKNNPRLGFAEFFRHDLMEPLPRSYDNIICLQTIEHISDPLRAFRNLLAAADRLLLVSVPYRNRRPDENHLWSFDESDFTDLAPVHRLGQENHNIFWLVDRQRVGFSFRGSRPIDVCHRLVDALGRCLRVDR